MSTLKANNLKDISGGNEVGVQTLRAIVDAYNNGTLGLGDIDPVQLQAILTAYENGELGGSSALPFFFVNAPDETEVIPASTFVEDGVYFVGSFNPVRGTVVTVEYFVDFMEGGKDIHIFTTGPTIIMGLQPDPEDPSGYFASPIANLTLGGSFSGRTLAVSGIAGVPVVDFLNNPIVDLANTSDPNNMYVARNPNGSLESQTARIAADYGAPGFEYHIMSDMDEPVYLEYADGSPITTASGFTNQLRTRYSVATIKKINDTTWVAFGDLMPAS
jgi:hypothetical protein